MAANVIGTRLVQTPRLSLNVREAGGGPLVVLLHGITANGAVWDPLTKDLASSFHVVAPDQRGHGLSSKPPDGYRAADFAADVVDLIDTIGEGPALVIGHSLGAQNALAIGALHPAKVTAVVAVEFCPYIEKERLSTMASRVASGDSRYPSLGKLLHYLAERYPLLPGAALLRRIEYGYRLTDRGYEPLASANAMSLAAQGLFDDLEEITRSCKPPALLIRGHESSFISRAAFAKTQLLRPDLEYREIAEADHHIPEERPQKLATIIANFAVRRGFLNIHQTAQ